MRFDHTRGKTAKYVVNLYAWNVEDHSYFHYYKEAKALFDRLKKKQDNGTTLSIYDLQKDERKAFARF